MRLVVDATNGVFKTLTREKVVATYLHARFGILDAVDLSRTRSDAKAWIVRGECSKTVRTSFGDRADISVQALRFGTGCLGPTPKHT